MRVTDSPDAAAGQATADPEHAAGFGSILFDDVSVAPTEATEPDYFRDLNLDQVLDAITAGREQYGLEPLFYQPLHDVAAVEYRHEVMRDLERPELASGVRAFASSMHAMREQLALIDKLRDPHQRERWFLSAVALYCKAVREFAAALAANEPDSRGLSAFARQLAAYAESDRFTELAEETTSLETELGEVRYTTLIKGLRVTVQPYADEPDLTDVVEETFARFRQGAVEDYHTGFANSLETDPVEKRILEQVAELNPELFARLRDYGERRAGYLEESIERFDREVQFYLGFLEYIEPLKRAGLSFSYPRVSTAEKRMCARQAFDLALAHKLVQDAQQVVCNDVELSGAERIVVITGPNQGGKTTFARAFGQLHHLAALGLPVSGSDTAVFLPDRLFTHFEREEDLATLRGKFEDELVRLHEILALATGDSVLIMNESFNSTTLRDALWVGEKVLRAVVERDMICLCVTFIDELASLAPSIVSMMSTVAPDDPTVRTFEVIRKPADGLAYAVAIAEKHGVSYRQLKRRVTG